MKQTKGVAVASLIGFIIVEYIFVAGWVLNVYKLIEHMPVVDLETLLRIAGIPLVPVGTLLGYCM